MYPHMFYMEFPNHLLHMLPCWLVHKEFDQLPCMYLSLDPKETNHDPWNAHDQNPLCLNSPTTLNTPHVDFSQEAPLLDHECHSSTHLSFPPNMMKYLLLSTIRSVPN
jgi:hypothetical protein